MPPLLLPPPSDSRSVLPCASTTAADACSAWRAAALVTLRASASTTATRYRRAVTSTATHQCHASAGRIQQHQSRHCNLRGHVRRPWAPAGNCPYRPGSPCAHLSETRHAVSRSSQLALAGVRGGRQSVRHHRARAEPLVGHARPGRRRINAGSGDRRDI
jgi:hypothetical protein